MTPTTSPAPARLWSGRAPGAIGDEEADIPTLTCFSPPDHLRTGAGFIVCPGGGYGHIAPSEGEPIARWLNSLGIFAAVLAYRHAPRYKHPWPLTDAQRAIRTFRHRAHEFGIEGSRIGIIGFSAGGHLSATVSTLFDAGDPAAADLIDREASNPNLSVLCYPVMTMIGDVVHNGSLKNLLGAEATDELRIRLSPERQVTKQTPPAFVFHTADDPGVKMENSLLYTEALRRAKVPVELHVFESGPHGVGLAEDKPDVHRWTMLCAAWLARHHFAVVT